MGRVHLLHHLRSSEKWVLCSDTQFLIVIPHRRQHSLKAHERSTLPRFKVGKGLEEEVMSKWNQENKDLLYF